MCQLMKMGKVLDILFFVAIGLNLVLCDEKLISRSRRDFDPELLALQAAGLAMDVFDRGAALEGNYEVGVNGFGVKSGSKIGFGEAMKNEKKRRRRRSLLTFLNINKEYNNNKIRERRSPCHKKQRNRSTTTDNPDDVDIDAEQKRKRRDVDPEDAEILPEFEDSNDAVSKWRKVLQIWSEMMQRLSDWASKKIQEATNSIK